jgi:glycosyltransferase involved in cell wall biosynthesis
MRVIYLAGFGSNFPSRDANSIHIMRMCEAIAKLGHEVILFASCKGESATSIFSFYGIPEIFCISIVKVPLIKGKTLLYSFKAGLSASKLKPDIVVGRSAQACSLTALMGTPVVFDSHGPVWEISKYEHLAFRLLCRSVNLKKMTTNSIALKKIYERKGLVPVCGITVAHNGSLELPLDDKLKNWPGRKDALQIGYLGHLYPGRGVDLIIECAIRLTGCDFHIVGGNNDDIEFWKQKGLHPNIFFHGFIPHSKIYRYRNNCDVLLAPYNEKNVSLAGGGGDQSRYMNPIKVIEYMSSRKAIICSDIPVLRELLDDDSAIFVKPGNLELWIDAILKLQDPVLREKISKNAYEKFKGKLTWEARAKTIISE